MKIISSIEEQPVIKQILQHLGLWEIRNTGLPKETHLNIVREQTYQPVPDQASVDDGFFSQVPDCGYWAKYFQDFSTGRHRRAVSKIPCFFYIFQCPDIFSVLFISLIMSCRIPPERPINMLRHQRYRHTRPSLL